MDVETGLPVLPDGMFWRVTQAWDHFKIQIRKRRRRSSELMYERYVYAFVPGREVEIADASEVTPQLIRLNARFALEEFEKRRLASSLVGDYPPKKLPE